MPTAPDLHVFICHSTNAHLLCAGAMTMLLDIVTLLILLTNHHSSEFSRQCYKTCGVLDFLH